MGEGNGVISVDQNQLRIIEAADAQIDELFVACISDIKAAIQERDAVGQLHVFYNAPVERLPIVILPKILGRVENVRVEVDLRPHHKDRADPLVHLPRSTGERDNP
eukprot:scaffold228_cov312-Pinguiococcus_pyrenoidosus.AAC.4